jgi:ASPM-SPD-2-Hydin domain-containing protein/HYDIN/CFA65/VesB family protein
MVFERTSYRSLTGEVRSQAAAVLATQIERGLVRNQEKAAKFGTYLLVALCCFSLLLIAGCGSTGVASSSSNTSNNPPQSSVSVAPSSLAFGNVTVGVPSVKNFVVTNSGTSDLVVSSVTLSGAGFSVSPLTFPLTIKAGANQSVSVTFTPQAAGAVSGSASIASNASTSPVSVPMTGTGVTTAVGALNLPSNLSFGSVNVGASSSQNLTLTNPSSVNVNVSTVTVSGAGFSSTVNGPFAVLAGKNTSVAIVFQPQTAGTASGTVTVASDAGNSPGTASLSGTGVGSGVQHSVDLNWNASTSTVAGYNVYRGSRTGGPYQLVNPSVASLAFTDSTVQSGTTYYYVVTAIDNSGVESNFSNEAVAVIPN